MEITESKFYDNYLGNMNPGGHYTGQAGQRPNGPQSDSRGDMPLPTTPAVGDTVRHRRSGEQGTVTGYATHGPHAERYPTVRWNGVPGGPGQVFDQGYSLDSLTNP